MERAPYLRRSCSVGSSRFAVTCRIVAGWAVKDLLQVGGLVFDATIPKWANLMEVVLSFADSGAPFDWPDELRQDFRRGVNLLQRPVMSPLGFGRQRYCSTRG